MVYWQLCCILVYKAGDTQRPMAENDICDQQGSVNKDSWLWFGGKNARVKVSFKQFVKYLRSSRDQRRMTLPGCQSLVSWRLNSLHAITRRCSNRLRYLVGIESS